MSKLNENGKELQIELKERLRYVSDEDSFPMEDGRDDVMEFESIAKKAKEEINPIVGGIDDDNRLRLRSK